MDPQVLQAACGSCNGSGPQIRGAALFGRHASSRLVHACNIKRAVLCMAVVLTAWLRHLQQLAQHKEDMLCRDRSQST